MRGGDEIENLNGVEDVLSYFLLKQIVHWS